MEYNLNDLLNQTYSIGKYEITNKCMDWCREAHFANNSNLTTEGILIIVLVFTLLIIAYFIYNFSNLFKDEKTAGKFFEITLEAAILLLIGFFIWFFWFMPK